MPPSNSSKGLAFNKCCFTFLISAQFLFPFIDSPMNSNFRKAAGELGVWYLSPASTYNRAGANERTCLLGGWDLPLSCLSLLPLNFPGSYLFKAALLTSGKQMRLKLCIIMFSDFSKPALASFFGRYNSNQREAEEPIHHIFKFKCFCLVHCNLKNQTS